VLHAALDTSAGVALAVARDAVTMVSISAENWHRQSDRELLPWLLRALAAAEIPLAQIQRWTVGTGPGSFVGLRVGIALVKGICRGSGATYRGIASSWALAQAVAADVAPGDRVLVVHDARRQQVIVTEYCRTAALLQAQGEAQVLDLSAATAAFAAAATVVSVHGQLLQLLFPEAVWAKVRCFASVPAALLLEAPHWPADSQHCRQSCEPIYVRPAVFVPPPELLAKAPVPETQLAAPR